MVYEDANLMRDVSNDMLSAGQDNTLAVGSKRP